MKKSRASSESPEAAISALVREHMPQLYRMGVGFCGNHADAQDLVQETLLRAYRKWDQFEGRADPKTWLYRIASRVCLRMRRRRAGQPAHLESLDEDPAFAEKTIVDLDALARRREEDVESDAVHRLQDDIAALPGEFRLVLVVKDLAGLSVEDTARVLGLKPQTVKTRLHRARMRLRRSVASALPRKSGRAPAYSRQVCLDLLKAKQEALDRGVPFPVQDSLVCERCQAVFATLDLGTDLCRRIGAGPLPPALRKLLS